MPKSNLPALPDEAHDGFQKANRLHEYVLDNLTTAAKYAYEAGMELLEAKKHVPHGGWVDAVAANWCASLSTAQSYMLMAKHMSALPKTQRNGILYLESTIDGAARVAKQLAAGNAPYEPPPPPTPDPEPVVISEEDGQTLEDAPDGSWVEVAGCDESENAQNAPENARNASSGNGKPPKQYDRGYWFKQYDTSIGPVARLVDKIAKEVGESHSNSHKEVQGYLRNAANVMGRWMGVDE